MGETYADAAASTQRDMVEASKSAARAVESEVA
jgi:hypothetical protein